MAQIIRDNLWLCSDCMILAVNNDPSGVDEYTAETCYAGLNKFGSGLVPNFDGETGEGENEFSWRHCESCSSNLGGARYRFAVLGID